MSTQDGVLTYQDWEREHGSPTLVPIGSDGPGAASIVLPIPLVEPHEGHALEPEYKRPAIGKDHILYPVMVSLALFPLLMGSAGHHIADDMPESDTHPFFPDHFWPYPVIMITMLITVGLLSALAQENMALGQPGDPRTVVIPRPDWYFLFLFQFLKLGPEILTAIVIPPMIALGLLIWPFIDQQLGIRLARPLGWKSWPVPGRNKFTGTGWVLFLLIIVLLTLWAVTGVTIFGISGG